MHELSVQGLSWCIHHGRPVVSLKPVDANWNFWITLSAEDAEAMALYSDTMQNSKVRAYELLEAVNTWLNVTVSGVRISFDHHQLTLRAHVHFEQQSGDTLTVPVNTTDAIVLAWRSPCPIWVDEGTLTHIQHVLADAHQGQQDTSDPTTSELTGPFRQFIETLDFGDADNRRG